MKKELELRVLEMCEKVLPKTSMSESATLKKLLADIRKDLEGA